MDQKLKLWVSPVTVKVCLFLNGLNGICATIRTTFGQNFSTIRRCLLELLSQKTQTLAQPKNVVVSSAKVKNGKYPKVETWHPESIDRWYYYRLCENLWWSFDPWWQFRPNLVPKNVFWLNFPRILWFFWDLGLTLSIIAKVTVFAEILVFSNFFGFLAVNWAPKWTKTVNFSCIPYEPKFMILKDFPNIVFFLLDITSGQSFNKIKQYLGEWRPKKSSKRTIFMDTESIQKTLKFFNFTTTFAILMKLIANIYILIRAFIRQNLGVYLIWPNFDHFLILNTKYQVLIN